MAKKRDLAEQKCFVAIPFHERFQVVRQAVTDTIERAGFVPVFFEESPRIARSVRETLMAEIAQAECVVADLSERNPNVHFELGLAMAMGKAVFPIVNRDSLDSISFDLRDLVAIDYEQRKIGDLCLRLSQVLQEFRHSPDRSRYVVASRTPTPFFIDWNRLDPSDAENLCLELLSQMGLRQVEWQPGTSEFDLVAEYPRKDPDGFEFKELWFVSTSFERQHHFEFMEMMLMDTEFALHRLTKMSKLVRNAIEGGGNHFTFLVIDLSGKKSGKKEFRRFSERFQERRDRIGQIRVRFWDQDDVAALIRRFPNIGYKYFSEEARSLNKFRKGPEELYQETLNLSSRLAKTNEELREERNLRIRAERDSIWKEISFAAAHKIGNPIFAIETDLAPLKKRVNEDRKEEAREVIDNMHNAVEKAKCIVDQFKSLTKAQKVEPVELALGPILRNACLVLKTKEVDCKIDCPRDLAVMGDPERLTEVFDELAANTLRWLDKSNRSFALEATLVPPENTPSDLDTDRAYALVRIKDNGPGIPVACKEQIFEAFYSTSSQGTGLGLALVRRIIEGHGGTITECGNPSEGVEFEMYLPIPKKKVAKKKSATKNAKHNTKGSSE